MSERASATETPVYAFKPSLLGSGVEFRLTPAALEFTAGSRNGRVFYRDIRRLRLSYRPTSVQSARYLTEIWPIGAGRLQIASTSRRTLMEAERHDAAYAAFVRDLAGRVAAANPAAEIAAGTLPLVYWPGVAVFAVLAVAMLMLAVRAVQTEQWAGAAIVIGFWAVFLWQIGLFFWRNRPRRCRGDDLPADILPTPPAPWRT